MRRAWITGAGAAGGIGFAWFGAGAMIGMQLPIRPTTTRIHQRAGALRAPGAVRGLVAGPDDALGPADRIPVDGGTVPQEKKARFVMALRRVLQS